MLMEMCISDSFRTTEQRICIKFCVKNNVKCSEVMKMLEKGFGKNAMSKPRIYEWYKHFQKGCEDT